jgi:hypothetical protein
MSQARYVFESRWQDAFTLVSCLAEISVGFEQTTRHYILEDSAVKYVNVFNQNNPINSRRFDFSIAFSVGSICFKYTDGPKRFATILYHPK